MLSKIAAASTAVVTFRDISGRESAAGSHTAFFKGCLHLPLAGIAIEIEHVQTRPCVAAQAHRRLSCNGQIQREQASQLEKTLAQQEASWQISCSKLYAPVIQTRANSVPPALLPQ
ncbi:hypothetical protein [Chelativorans sp. Marseille-P2723]|uniref:hypothetical protein n=1 Tax=Chelativorans sp. Marseille-P2723 TaxID=2709133 RepID=UPI00156FCFDA|nr:hypothetical protein [Chelativorans sp. Marseille-P2723]